ncbi:MAG: oxidative damage protection protein [Gammaproteobacteria bacterium]|nr:oxidative damage protection protein [Gammaproteobacteria bacterium]
MAREINCTKLGKLSEGLEKAPYPGELGQKIYENISKEAWQLWLKQQTILMNEYRLSPINPDHRQFLEKEMDKFFFSDGESEMPADFNPQ